MKDIEDAHSQKHNKVDIELMKGRVPPVAGIYLTNGGNISIMEADHWACREGNYG
jgi:hypothetical protein